MRDIVEKKYTGHGPSRNIASFENEFYGLFEEYLGQKLTGYGNHYTQSTGTQNFQVSQWRGINRPL